MHSRLLVTGLFRSSVSARAFRASGVKSESFRIQNPEDFRARVLNSSKPVIVDFSAEWCGPCKILTPRLDAAVAAAEEKVDLAIVDIDEHGDLALDHDVSAVPTVVALKDGEVVDRFVGLIDEDKLESFITKLHS